MTEYDKSLNEVYTFTDALKVVQELLNVAREERDSYRDASRAYCDAQVRVEAFEDVLTTLSIENSVRHYITQSEDRDYLNSLGD